MTIVKVLGEEISTRHNVKEERDGDNGSLL